MRKIIALLLILICSNLLAQTETSPKVPNQYIVVFKTVQSINGTSSLSTGATVSDTVVQLMSEINDRQALINNQNTTAGIANAAVENKVLYEYEHAIKGFSATFTQDAVDYLQGHSLIEYIEEDQIYTTNITQSPVPSWGLDRVDQTNLPLSGSYTYDSNGTNVHAYIIDTGIQSTHNEYAGRVGNGVDYVDGGAPGDCNGHGTHVSGTIGGSSVGIAKNTILHGVRVCDCLGQCSTSSILAGINWVTSNRISPAVINMSLGGSYSSAINSATNNSSSSGITVVVAAGNYNRNACLYSPASASNAITVGSTTISDNRSSFSNFGSCVDVFAPGSNITSSWRGSSYNTISGTSMASPHVAGAAARYLDENPTASPSQVTSAMKSNASVNKVNNAGSGSPNLLLNTNYIDPPNRAPIINQPPTPQQHTQGAPINLLVTASDPDGDTLIFSATTLAPGLSISSVGRITGTLASVGNFISTVTVSDGSLTDSVTIRWLVAQPNRAPVINQPPTPQEHKIEDTVSLLVTATDPDGGQLTFTASNLPPGLSISSSGLISGTLTSSGEYLSSITVSDGSLTDLATVRWIITKKTVMIEYYEYSIPVVKQ